jgi:probable rRNA maturation factor
VSVSVSDGRGRPVRDGGLARWLEGAAPRGAHGEVAVALVSDARMRALNRTYRRRDYATDVLSFPDLSDGITAPRRVPLGRRPLGDLVIATGVARRQAREAGHSYQMELRVLALHGLLHLLGYDHEDRSDRRRMTRVEERLRRRSGLVGGLIRRNSGKRKTPRERGRAPASIKR